MSIPNNKAIQKTTSKSPEQLNMPFSQTHSWMNGNMAEIFTSFLYFFSSLVSLFVSFLI